MKIAYIEKRFADSTLVVLGQANKIIEDYMKQGFNLTLRQLYYQFVAHDIFPDDRTWRLTGSNKWVRDPNGTKNAEPNYKWLGSIINDGRLAGYLNWLAIEDRGRHLIAPTHWENPAEIINNCADSYAIDRWADQDFRVEVWVEKEALIGVIERASMQFDVSCFACKGYTSQSQLWRASRRFKTYERMGQQPVVIHLGDHDPSGIDMTRDIGGRLNLFGCTVEVNRIALNMDQVDEYDPPPNPAKLTDSRAMGYIQEFGNSSWELDALKPQVLHELITETILSYIDKKKFEALEKREEKERQELSNMAEEWEMSKEDEGD